MNTINTLAACAVLVCMSPLAAGQKWTWEAGKQTSNGQITVKSLSGSTTYIGTQNPTGAVAKTNQNAVTQPPTVIIQATSGGGGACVAMSRTKYNGNLGGVSGADAKCAAEFGTGWRFADLFSASSCISIGIDSNVTTYEVPWYWTSADDAYSCGKWTTNDSGANGTYLTRQISGGAYFIGPGFRNCGSQYSLLCAKLQ